MEANSTGGQGLRRAVAPSDDDDDDYPYKCGGKLNSAIRNYQNCICQFNYNGIVLEEPLITTDVRAAVLKVWTWTQCESSNNRLLQRFYTHMYARAHAHTFCCY